MAGLYIHIPFCKSRCIYCGFYSTTLLGLRQRYVDAVCREMEMRGKGIRVLPNDEESIDTIYIGGGTPSQLTHQQLQQLCVHINKVYGLPLPPEGDSGRVEFTMEVNPDDVTAEYATILHQLGINRVSMGVQTFDNQRLRFLYRRHTAEQVPVAIHHLRNAGFHNISIDLMYGFPGETLEDWQYDISQALALHVEHLSAYCLSIEEGTPLWKLKMKDETFKMPDEELERQMYEMLINKVTEAGYEHYEISNFAKHGFYSRHNSSYWHDVPYIGIGAAAHSYDRHTRSWNVSDIHQYIKAIERGERSFGEELIDADTHYNDSITVALRTKEGLDLNSLTTRYRQYITEQARPYIVGNLLRIQDHHLILTRKGLFVSDMVMSDLMMVD